MAQFEITLDLKGFNKTLDEIQDAVKQGTENGLKQLASEMKQMEHDIIDSNIGGDGSYVRTGKLKSSITIMPITWSNGLAEISVVPKGCNYAIYNELGTGIYADNGNGRKDDRTDGSWRKSSEQSEEAAVEEAAKEEPAEEEAGKKEAEEEN